MDDAPAEAGLPPGLRLLKGLVIALTVTLIVGVITIVSVIVTRMPRAAGAVPVLPATLVLPEGARALAVTQGNGWFAVVTADDRILIFGADGTLRQTVGVTSLR